MFGVPPYFTAVAFSIVIDPVTSVPFLKRFISTTSPSESRRPMLVMSYSRSTRYSFDANLNDLIASPFCTLAFAAGLFASTLATDTVFTILTVPSSAI